MHLSEIPYSKNTFSVVLLTEIALRVRMTYEL